MIRSQRINEEEEENDQTIMVMHTSINVLYINTTNSLWHFTTSNNLKLLFNAIKSKTIIFDSRKFLEKNTVYNY